LGSVLESYPAVPDLALDLKNSSIN
jgi:hypothetical protein